MILIEEWKTGRMFWKQHIKQVYRHGILNITWVNIQTDVGAVLSVKKNQILGYYKDNDNH